MGDSIITDWTAVGAEDALEGRLRRQLEVIGVDRARNMAATALDRRCVEAAYLVLSDEEGTPGYVHAGFAMTALPHKRTDAAEWIRDGADIRLRIESGKRHDGTIVGIPFGYVARLIVSIRPRPRCIDPHAAAAVSGLRQFQGNSSWRREAG